MVSRLKCPNCGDIIESKHRHDFVVCKCWNAATSGIFLDGGPDYPRFGGAHMVGAEFVEAEIEVPP